MLTNWLRLPGDGGDGFCYDVDRTLFTDKALADGPLLVALDTVILIDLAEHGSDLVGDLDLPSGLDGKHASDLDGLGFLLDVWLMRDIRFVPLKRSLTDFKRNSSEERVQNRYRYLAALDNSLAFQTQDWDRSALEEPIPTNRPSSVEPELTKEDIPGDADRDLITEAVARRVDVFLTRDDRLLAANSLPAITLHVVSPNHLAEWLKHLNITHFAGGHVPHDACLYDGGLPAPDMGKWVDLLTLLSNSPFATA